MKNFSNETKRKRRNAVLKVVLKRYSFIVWLPLLLYISYHLGKFIILVSDGNKNYYNSIIMTVIITILGIVCIYSSFLIIAFIIVCIYDIIIIPIKEKGFFCVLKSFFKSVGKFLLNLIKVVPIILLTILKSPIYLYKRIKDEKRCFQNAIEKQISKDNNKKSCGDIEN